MFTLQTLYEKTSTLKIILLHNKFHNKMDPFEQQDLVRAEGSDTPFTLDKSERYYFSRSFSAEIFNAKLQDAFHAHFSKYE